MRGYKRRCLEGILYSYALPPNWRLEHPTHECPLKKRVFGTHRFMLTTAGVIPMTHGYIKGKRTAAINRITVTNFTDTTDKASLETDLVKQECNFYITEGQSGYQGCVGVCDVVLRDA